MKSKVCLALILSLFQSISVNHAIAGPFLSSTLSEIQNYPPYIQDSQKIRKFEVGLSSEDSNLVIFSAFFVNGVNANTVSQNGSDTPLLRIKIFYSSSLASSNLYQYSIDAPITPYKGETKLDAITNSNCSAKTWIPAGGNSISFEVNRICLNLPDKFFASLSFDANIKRDGNDSYSIPEQSTLPIDFSKFPKPLPKKDQVIAGFTQQSSYTLDVSVVNFSTSTNSGLPIQILGTTPNTCSVTSSNSISIFKEGICTINLSSPGNDLWNPAVPTSFSFTILPKKPLPKIDQKLYFNRPEEIYENVGEFKLDIYSESGLPVVVTSSTPNICSFPYQAPNNTVAKIYSYGTCRFTVSQSGNERFNPREGWAEIEIAQVQRATAPAKKSNPAPTPTKKPVIKQQIEISSSQTSTEGGKSSGTAAKSGSGVNKGGTTSITCFDPKIKKSKTYENRKTCPAGMLKK